MTDDEIQAVRAQALAELTDETCATCEKAQRVTDLDWTAHWGGPGRVTIVAWTCSPACTDTYMNGGIR